MWGGNSAEYHVDLEPVDPDRSPVDTDLKTDPPPVVFQRAGADVESAEEGWPGPIDEPPPLFPG